LSEEALLLNPPDSAPPITICEPSEIRADEGYHLEMEEIASMPLILDKQKERPIGSQPHSAGIVPDFARAVIVGSKKPDTHVTILGSNVFLRVTAEAGQGTIAEPSATLKKNV
jgi:hypothetical protein